MMPSTESTVPSLATIRAALEQTYGENRALIAGLSDADLDLATPNPAWKVRQLAAHIAEDDGGTVYVGKRLAAGKNATAPNVLINLVNWWGLRNYKRSRSPDLVTVMDAKHRELLAWLDTLTPEQLARGGDVSQMGRLTVAQFLSRNRAHSADHGADIRAALARPSARP